MSLHTYMSNCREIACIFAADHSVIWPRDASTVLTGLHRRWTQQQSVAEAGAGALAKTRASSPNAETAFKSGLSDPGAKTSITITGRSPSKLSRAAAKSPDEATANGLGGAAPNGPVAEQSLNGLVTALEDDQEIQNIRAMMRRQPFRHKTQLEYYALPAAVKVQRLPPCKAVKPVVQQLNR